jgi:hypothetical protein
MTFRQFLVNYFSPVYFVLRCCWLISAFVTPVFTMFVLTGQGASPALAKLCGIAIAAACVWVALKPWKVGASIADIQRSVDEIHKRMK